LDDLEKEQREAELCRKHLTTREQTQWKLIKILLNQSTAPLLKPSFDATREDVEEYKEYQKLFDL